MEDADTDTAAEFRADIAALPAEMAAGVTSQRANMANSHWHIWCEFCARHGHDPGLSRIHDPIPWLQVFMRRFRDGRLAPRGNPVSARHAEDAVRSVGQALAQLGAGDPRQDPRTSRLDFRLS